MVGCSQTGKSVHVVVRYVESNQTVMGSDEERGDESQSEATYHECDIGQQALFVPVVVSHLQSERESF